MSARFMASAAAALALGACAFEPILTAQVVDYNRIAEDAGNSVLLLNVLRAKDRRPFYFTHLQSINPSLNTSIGLNATIPFHPAQYTTLSLNPSGRIDLNNQGAVATEAGKEFVRGITATVQMDTFDYYWQRGWPRGLLLNLLVQKVEIAVADSKGEPDLSQPIRVYFNAPSMVGALPSPEELKIGCVTNTYRLGQGRAQFACFQRTIRLLEPVLRVATRSVPQNVTNEVGPNAAELKDWKLLIEAVKSGFSLVQSGANYRLVKTSEVKQFCIFNPRVEWDPSAHKRSSTFPCRALLGVDQSPTAKIRRQLGEERVRQLTIPMPPRQRKGDTRSPVLMVDSEERREAIASYDELDELCGPQRNCIFSIQLRSPESVLYYLGEIARAQLVSKGEFNVLVFNSIYSDDKQTPVPPGCRDAERAGKYFMSLFQIRAGTVAGSPASVRYNGETYSIPGDGCHLSTQALTLAAQLISLQRDAKELPTITNVRVLGP